MPRGRRLDCTSHRRPDTPSSRRTSPVANGYRGTPLGSDACRSRSDRGSSRRRLAGRGRHRGGNRNGRRGWLDDGLRCRPGRGRGRRSRLARRKQRQRIDIAARIVRAPGAELDVRLGSLRVSAWPNRPDRLALRNAVSDRDGDRAQVRERRGPTVGSSDRDGLPVRWQRAGEAHTAGGRCEHRGVDRAADVDSPMARRGVGIAAVVERTEELALGRPRPAPGTGRSEQDQSD
jgi:hypothetical protein